MTRPWWHERVAYQVYPRSFQDTNGDGIGDIPGITRHLDDLQALGIGILWLSPVYRSPNADFGYDISDYRAINPEYGTLDDLRVLFDAARARDIRIVMDLVVNHTSDQHEWFQKSRCRIAPYTDYYIWAPGRGGGPPNNWTSFFGGGAWTFDELRGEYYLHLFTRGQPDLNYRCPAVFDEVADIMRFWLGFGASGFRCDVINLLWKDSLADGRRSLFLTGTEHYVSTAGTHELLHRLRREVLDHCDCFTLGEAFLVPPEQARAFCAPERNELDMLLYFTHMDSDAWMVKWFKRRFHAGRFLRAIAEWQAALDWNANYLENHDQPRSVSRFGDDRNHWLASARLLAVLILTLRGTPFLFQGEEIGMTNFDYTSMAEIRDPESIQIEALARRLHFPQWLRWRLIRLTGRDNARTPMQWNASPGAGFTTGTPWIGINRNHTTINYAVQSADPDSLLHFYRRLIALRNSSAVLIDGSFRLLAATRHLCAYERTLAGETWTILLNFSPRSCRSSRLAAPADDAMPEPVALRQAAAPLDGASPASDADAALPLVLSSAGRITYDGVLAPYEAVILRRRTGPAERGAGREVSGRPGDPAGRGASHGSPGDPAGRGDGEVLL